MWFGSDDRFAISIWVVTRVDSPILFDGLLCLLDRLYILMHQPADSLITHFGEVNISGE